MKKYLIKLLNAVIHGVADSGAAFLAVSTAQTLGVSVNLNLRELGIILIVSTLINLFNFLKTNPIPNDEDQHPLYPFPPEGTEL